MDPGSVVPVSVTVNHQMKTIISVDTAVTGGSGPTLEEGIAVVAAVTLVTVGETSILVCQDSSSEGKVAGKFTLFSKPKVDQSMTYK